MRDKISICPWGVGGGLKMSARNQEQRSTQNEIMNKGKTKKKRMKKQKQFLEEERGFELVRRHISSEFGYYRSLSVLRESIKCRKKLWVFWKYLKKPSKSLKESWRVSSKYWIKRKNAHKNLEEFLQESWTGLRESLASWNLQRHQLLRRKSLRGY